MTWTLHDATGPVRTGIGEDELRELMHLNADEGTNTWGVNADDHTQVITEWDQPAHVAEQGQ